MSFPKEFEKTAKNPAYMSDMELFLKTDKHLGKSVKHEYSPYTGSVAGAAAGGAVGGIGKLWKNKPKTLKGVAGTAALGSLAGAATGYGVKKFHQNRLRKYVNELATRGYYPSSRGGRISWKRYQSALDRD